MPKRVPAWKVEVAGIDQKGNWATMGRPVQMANLFAKTRGYQSQKHSRDPLQILTWWKQEGLESYTTKPIDVIANTIISGLNVPEPGAADLPVIQFAVTAGDDMNRVTARAGGSENNSILVQRKSLSTPTNVGWSAISTSIPTELGGNGGPSLPASPCFSVKFYKYRRGDDDLRPSTTEYDGACFWPVPRYTPHIAIQWGGRWELYIEFTETGTGGFRRPRQITGIGRVILTYYRDGKYWIVSDEGWSVPASAVQSSAWIADELVIGVCEIGGRLVVYFNNDTENARVVIPREQVPDYDENDPTNEDLPVAVMSGSQSSARFDTPPSSLSIHGDNISAQFSVQGIDFLAGGWVSERYRIYPRGQDIVASSAKAFGYVPVDEPGSGLFVAVDDLPTEPLARPLKLVTCTIVKEAGNECRASPMLTGYSIQQPGEWLDAVQTFVDISNSVTRISESSIEPSAIGTAEFVVDLDVALLDKFYPDWRDNVKMTVPVRVWMGWDDEIVPRLDGYVYEMKSTVSAYNDQRIQLICRDPMMRTQVPVGVIDFQYSPLDCYAVHLERTAFGWEAVQGILRTALGDTLADSLYLAWPADHHDLYGALPYTRGGMISGAGTFFWAPEWGREYLYDWLSKVALYDGSLLYIRPTKVGFAGEWTGEWTNVLFYVGWNEFRKPEYEGIIWNTHYCYDALYVAGVKQLGGSVAVEGETEIQYDSHIKHIEAQWRLREAINIIEVWARDSKAPYPIAVYYDEDPKIGNPAAPNYVGWEQKLIYEVSSTLPERIGRAIGVGLGQRFFNRRPIRPAYKTLGQPDWWWGDIVIPSGNQIGIEGDVLRIWKLNSIIDCDALTYETTVTLVEEAGGVQ